MKIFLVHHESFVPNEGITKYKVRAFKYYSDARDYCIENSIRVEEDGYNPMLDEDRVEYVVYDNWSPEYMWIEEVELYENKEQDFERLYGR